MSTFLQRHARKLTALIVVVALAAVALMVVAWPRSEASTVLVAAKDLAEGDVVSAGDIVSEQVNLAGSTALYAKSLPIGAVLLRGLPAGSLIAKADIVPSATQTRLASVIEFHESLPSGVRVGADVDIWATPKVNQSAGEPKAVGLGCQVSAMHSSSGLGQATTAVELLCPPEFLPEIMRSKTAEDQITLVPQPNLLNQ